MTVTVDLSQALLPSIPISLRVKSHTDEGVVYDVDLNGPTCSCVDWVSRRRHLSVGDLSRCCKHVLDAFARLRPAEGWPAWLGAFLDLGWRPHPEKRWFVLSVDENHILGSVGGNDWTDVFAPAEVGYRRFGYNVAERRWSYGLRPDAADNLERALLREAGIPVDQASQRDMERWTALGPAQECFTGQIAGTTVRAYVPLDVKRECERLLRKADRTDEENEYVHDHYWVNVYYKGQRHGYHGTRDFWTYSADTLPELPLLHAWMYRVLGTRTPEIIGSLATEAQWVETGSIHANALNGE